MSKELNIREELDFYRRELLENILPFWIERALDRDYGGYFTCFNNGGTELVSTDKYVWSQVLAGVGFCRTCVYAR